MIWARRPDSQRNVKRRFHFAGPQTCQREAQSAAKTLGVRCVQQNVIHSARREEEMMSTTDEIAAKLERAGEHLDALDEEVKTYLATGPFDVVEQDYRDFGGMGPSAIRATTSPLSRLTATSCTPLIFSNC